MQSDKLASMENNYRMAMTEDEIKQFLRPVVRLCSERGDGCAPAEAQAVKKWLGVNDDEEREFLADCECTSSSSALDPGYFFHQCR